MMLFIHACFLSAVAGGGGDLCMPFDAARAGFCLFYLQGQQVACAGDVLNVAILCIAYITCS